MMEAMNDGRDEKEAGKRDYRRSLALKSECDGKS